MVDNNKNIIGCFVSGQATMFDDNEDKKAFIAENNKLFRSYIWGENGICEVMKKLNRENYGNDLALILFQFYINPVPYELKNIKEIENYRKNEKSIGIPVIVNDNNFFNKSDKDRFLFLKNEIIRKLDILDNVIKIKKLDTKINLLKTDLENILS